MKLVCILFSISIIVNICAWCAFIIASDYSIIDDSYLSNLNYLNLIFIAFPASIVELIPLVLCVLMLIYNKIKHNAKVLLKVCAYVMAALNLWILVQRLLNQNDDTNKLTTSGYFLFVLPQIISIVLFLQAEIRRFQPHSRRKTFSFHQSFPNHKLRHITGTIPLFDLQLSGKLTRRNFHNFHIIRRFFVPAAIC